MRKATKTFWFVLKWFSSQYISNTHTVLLHTRSIVHLQIKNQSDSRTWWITWLLRTSMYLLSEWVLLLSHLSSMRQLVNKCSRNGRVFWIRSIYIDASSNDLESFILHFCLDFLFSLYLSYLIADLITFVGLTPTETLDYNPFSFG